MVMAGGAIALSLVIGSTLASTNAPALPPAIAAIAPALKVQGGGLMTFFGISVYDGWYWSATPGWPQSGPYALDLHYHRSLEGARIAERSVDEIAKLGFGSVADRNRWGISMTRLFPDVKPGDRLTGVNVGAGVVRYFYNGKSIGEISDVGFADAFFGIWLHPKTSRADFRLKLLGSP
ncbi:MAG: chalcone isomerase family protein [Betaproteobacteria bacterium]